MSQQQGFRKLIPDLILSQSESGRRRGRFGAAAMFVDMSGFTALTETLMQHDKDGAEVLTEVLNGIFNPIVHEVYARGGFISTFAGDAFTALFPLRRKDAARQAGQAARFARDFFEQQGLTDTKYGVFQVGVKIGLALGEVEWGILGTDDLSTFFFRGPAIDACAAAEHAARPGDIVADSSLIAVLQADGLAPAPDAPARLQTLPDAPPRKRIRRKTWGRRRLQPFVLDAVLDLSLQAEFRQITSVFISFDDPDDAETLNEFVTAALTLARAYGGYFNKLDFGDKGGVILALFGAPVAHEHDPERAANYLLALRERNFPLRWRAGMTLGVVYAGIVGGEHRCEYTAIGDIVNLSARLMMRADWGEIWASAALARRLETAFNLEALGTFQFKGKGGAIPAFRLNRKREGVDLRLYEGEMVGREAELAELHEIMRPLFAARRRKRGTSPGVTYIHGEAGMGKSRLVFEFRRALVEQQDVRWAFCPADGVLRQSLNPFEYFLRGYFQQSSDASALENRERFDNALAVLFERLPADDPAAAFLQQDLQRTRSMLGAMVNLHWPNSLYQQLEPKLRFENTLSALIDLLKAESLIQPLLLEIDDANLIDADSSALLQTLTREIAGYPIAVIVCSRYNDDGSPFRFDLDPDIRQHEINLHYLSSDGVKTFAEQVLEAEIDAEAVRFLIEKTDGNPFFVEQLTLDLYERRLFVPQDDESGLLTVCDTAADVPTTINAVLIARLDRLTADIRQIVQTAAVLGREFELQVLSRMLKNDPALETKVAEAEAANIWSPLSEIRYIFKHALMRDSVYDMQLRARLRDLHRLAGEALEQLFAHEPEAHSVDMAYHFEEAGVIDKTILYLSMAANQAKENYQNELALSLYDRLLRFTDPDQPQIVLIHEQRGDIFGNISEYDNAIAAYMAGLEALQRLPGDARTAARLPELQRKVAMTYVSKGDYELGREWLNRAIASIDDENSVAMARVCTGMGGVLFRLGEAVEALAWCERALGIAEVANEPRERARAYITRGTTNTGLGNLDDAIDDYQNSIRLARDLDDPVELTKAHNSIGAVYHYKGNWERAIQHYQQSLEIAEEIGHIEQQAIVSNNLGEVFLIQGNFDEALGRFENCLRTFRRTGFTLGVALTHRNMAQIYVNLGEWQRAGKHVDACRETLTRLKSRDFIAAEAYRLGAEIQSALENREKAWDLCQKALDIAISQDLKLVEGNTRRVLGVLHTEAGQWDEAERELNASVAVAKELGLRHEQGQALLALARLYRTRLERGHGGRFQAQWSESVAAAMALFEALGAEWDLARAQAMSATG